MVKSFVNIKHSNRSHLYWGIDKTTGEVVEINQVQNRGLNCNCQCAACKGDFIARKGEINKHHFAHKSNYECVYANEIAIYLLAQKILNAMCEMDLPCVTVDIGRRTETAKNAHSQTPSNSYYQCEPEQYPPLLLTTLGRQPTRIILAFGNYYTTADYELLRKEAASYGWDCLSIALPYITDRTSISYNQLAECLSHQIEGKAWIRNSLQERWLKRLSDAATIPDQHLVNGRYIRYECPIHCQKDGDEFYANISDCDFCAYNLTIDPDCKCLAYRGIKHLHDFSRPEADLQAEIARRRKENEERLQLIAELRKQQQDRQKTIPKHPLPKYPLSQFTKPKYSREEQLKLGKEEVLHRFNNPTDEPIFDRFNTRWVKCERCNNILSSDQMSSYGGRGKAHLGICRECSRK